MLVGYARTSTTEQRAGIEAQERDLKRVGVDRLFFEQVSSIGQRDELRRALEFVREGDTLVVTKLDRLARSVSHLSEIVKQLEGKKVELRILDFGGSSVDTRSSTGRLMLNMFGAMAQFEREMMLERQREGIAKAKAEKKYKGRAPTALRMADEVMALAAQGFAASAIASRCSISRASVYRIFNMKKLNPGSASPAMKGPARRRPISPAP
jgi:DNA invertase Pin-like site-specific DNA recombinase